MLTRLVRKSSAITKDCRAVREIVILRPLVLRFLVLLNAYSSCCLKKKTMSSTHFSYSLNVRVIRVRHFLIKLEEISIVLQNTQRGVRSWADVIIRIVSESCVICEIRKVFLRRMSETNILDFSELQITNGDITSF